MGGVEKKYLFPPQMNERKLSKSFREEKERVIEGVMEGERGETRSEEHTSELQSR